MSIFSESEIAYLNEQLLGRLATVGEDGQPHAVPVGFRFNAEHETIDIGGHGLGQSKKYRDAAGNPRVAFVVDDLASVDPWRPRGIEIRGLAELHASGGENIGPAFGGAWIQITPRRIISWGFDSDRFGSANSRSVG